MHTVDMLRAIVTDGGGKLREACRFLSPLDRGGLPFVSCCCGYEKNGAMLTYLAMQPEPTVDKMVIQSSKGETAMQRKATAADAELCIKLYELRREAEMRKARSFIGIQFQPRNIDDVLKIFQSMGTQENAWARQVFSYWENAASLVLNGIVHPGLFFAWNGEMVFLYAKFQPFINELRKEMENPALLSNVEKVVNSSPEAKKRVAVIQKRLAGMAEKAQAAKAK